jgi:hypothetical protein
MAWWMGHDADEIYVYLPMTVSRASSAPCFVYSFSYP